MIENLMNLLHTNTVTGMVLEIGIIGLFILIAIMIVKSVYSGNTKKLKNSFTDLLNKDREVNYNKYYSVNRGVDVDMGKLDEMQMHFIERSNIKQYIPFMNLYLLLFILSMVFVISTVMMLPVVGNIITASILAAVVSSVPLMILDLLGKQMSERARRDLYTYISTLKSWANMKSDIVFIFDRTAQGVTGPLSSHTRQMVAQIKAGLPADVALELLRLKVNNQYFDTFILNISQAFDNQGDLVKLLAKLEKEAFKLEKAYNDRKIRTLLDRTLVFGFMIVTLIIAVSLLYGNETVRDTFVDTTGGQIVLALSTLVFALGIFLQFRITNFEH
ncbi:MAG: type II secretion system F family protein [Clostridiales bacterium]|nr:type II secretion system F family protein [Clostridiales bacterium]